MLRKLRVTRASLAEEYRNALESCDAMHWRYFHGLTKFWAPKTSFSFIRTWSHFRLTLVYFPNAKHNLKVCRSFSCVSDESLISYIKNGIKDNHLILVASQDEASFK